ncbi:MAG: BatA domain-containing protein, partial [bacterium]
MTFIHPGILWFLSAVSIPLILHFIFLRRSRKINFSSIFLLRQVYLKSLPRSRLEQWLLLALRCLVLLMVISAFSRPVLRSMSIGRLVPASASSGSLRLVVLCDVSYSMKRLSQGEEVYSLARSAGKSILKNLRSGDKAALAFFSDRPEGAPPEWSSDFERLAGALDSSSAGFGKTDYMPALEQAYRFLGTEKEGRKAVVVLSDGARHGFRKGKDISLLPFYDSRVLLAGLHMETHPDNAWVDSFYVAGAGFWDFFSAGRSGEIRLESVLKLSGADRSGWPVSLDAGSAGRWHSRADLSGRAPASVSWTIPTAADSLAGKVELRRDILPVDDSRFFSADVLRKPKILCAYADPAFMDAGREGYFLAKILGPGRQNRLPFSCDFAEWSRLEEAGLAGYSAVILSGFSRIRPGMVSRLDSYVRGGGGLWIVPSPSLEPGGLAELRNLLPVHLGETLQRKAFLVPVLPAPEVAGFKWEDFELSGLEAARFFSCEPAAGSTVTWRFSVGGREWPAMSGRKTGRGRVLFWASTLAPGWTSLALKPVFAAWLAQSLAWVCAVPASERINGVLVDQPFEKRWENPAFAPSRVKVSAPDGSVSVVQVRDGAFRFDGTGQPGLYRWQAAPPDSARGREYGRAEDGASLNAAGTHGSTRHAGQGVFAVNIDHSSGESDLTGEKFPPWKKLGFSTVSEDFSLAVHGAEIWPL